MSNIRQFIVAIIIAAALPACFYFAFRPAHRGAASFSAQADQPYDPIEPAADRQRPRVMLDGKWTFRLAGSEKATSVLVPHVWNFMPGLEDFTGAAAYSRQFEVPVDWAKKRVLLELEGVASGADVVVNGQLMGRAEDGSLPAEFDITDELNFRGKNQLELIVDNKPYAGAAAGAAVKNFGGLFREPFLEARTESYIEDARLTGVALKPGLAEATFHITLVLPAGGDFSLLGSLGKPGGGTADGFASTITAKPGSGVAELDWTASVANPQLWSPGNPALYELVITLSSPENGADGLVRRFGLRTFDADGAAFRLNGNEIYLRGVDRVEELPDGLGSVETAGGIERDIESARAAGFNTIRAAFAPPHPAFLDACDGAGMFAAEDIPLWNIGEKELLDKDTWRRASDLLRRMIARDAHHPSVIMWGIGTGIDTSGPAGRKFAADMAAAAAELDPTRPVYIVPAPGVTAAPGGGNPASLNTGALDMDGNFQSLRPRLDALEKAAAGGPALVFGQGAQALPGNSSGAGRPGAEQNQLRLTGESRIEIDSLEWPAGDFIHALSDYSLPPRLKGHPEYAFYGITTSDREPKPAFDWLVRYGKNNAVSVPKQKLAPLPVAMPPAELILTIMATLLAFIFWSGYGKSGDMLVTPHLAGPVDKVSIELERSGDAAAVASAKNSNVWVIQLLKFGAPALVCCTFAGGIFINLALQKIHTITMSAPGWFFEWCVVLETSLAARLALAFAALVSMLLLTGAITGVLSRRGAFSCAELFSRCIVPRLFWFIPLALPFTPLPLFALLMIWESNLRIRSLNEAFEITPSRSVLYVIVAPVAAAAIVSALLFWPLHADIVSPLKSILLTYKEIFPYK